MADFVLVHGSGQNAGCWSRVSSVLRTRGHAVAAPDLPKQAPGWGLEDYAAEIADSVVGGPHTVADETSGGTSGWLGEGALAGPDLT